MVKKSSIWLVVLISIVAISVVSSGCSKKQMVKEEVGGKPSMEAKKAAPAPAPKMEPPKTTPAPAPKAEARPAPKVEAAAPAPFDVTGMRIQFAFDDYSLSTKSQENLEKIASWMKNTPDAKIQIQGNTCNIGTSEYNLALGEQRAASAKTYLERLGISGGRLSTISYGLEKPRVPNTDEANRSLNRRDEFVSIK
ncbi:MAG: OmpA family protein [Thermodesulfobacteriota bacterium]|jgi:peptidoglycan-associated lipoprotein